MRSVIWIFFLLVSFGGLSPNVYPSDETISVEAKVDKAFITIGDPITYSVIIEHSPDILLLSGISAPRSEALEIKRVQDISSKENGNIIFGKIFILTSYKLGEFSIEPISIDFRKKDGETETIKTQKLYLTVKSVAEGEEKEDIRDVKSVIKIPSSFVGLFIFLGIILFVALLLFIYKKFIYRKNRTAETVPFLSPYDEAIFSLNGLFDSDLLKKRLVKQYFLRLSEILKIYFEKRYHISAVESTTTEITRLLKKERIESALLKKIDNVLNLSDLAKFAKWIPNPSTITELNKNALEIIEDSKEVSLSQEEAEKITHGI